MTPTKLLIGQALIVFAIVIGGVWATTQWTAAMLGYQPRLGAPWFELLHWPVYYPWRLFEWRSEEHTSELQSLMRISYAVFCLTKKNKHKQTMKTSCK